MNYDAVSFPNLDIGQIKLDPIAVEFGGFAIRWYAIFICIGIIVAAMVGSHLCKRFGVKKDDMLDCLLYTLPIAFVGARLTYVLGDLDSFNSFMDVIAIWNGGLAIYGGVIFAAISVFVICKLKKCNVGAMVDIMAVGLLIGQIIGRLGNFVNIEVYGIETNLPWAMGIGYFGEDPEMLVHPLFLYEMLWNTIGLVLVIGYLDYRKFNGEVFMWYMAWYGLGRALMEPLRDPQYNLELFGVRIMIILAAVLCVASVVAIVILRKKSPGYVKAPAAVDEPAEKTDPDYERQFNITHEDLEGIELSPEELEAKKLYEKLEQLESEETENEAD